LRQDVSGGYDAGTVLVTETDSEDELVELAAEHEAETRWTLVVVESPFRGEGTTDDERQKNQRRNEQYARECMRDCLSRNEAPFASHLLYTQPGVLDDQQEHERNRGIRAGLAWGVAATKTVVYDDLGTTEGMEFGIERAKRANREVERRSLPGWKLPDYAAKLERRVAQLEKACKGPPVEVDWSEKEETQYFRYWSRCEDVTMHFNELSIKFRLQAISGLAVTGAIAGALVKTSDASSWILLGGGLALLAVFWLAAAWIDFFYYGRLLRGAIEELQRVEALSGSGDGINLSTSIESATKQTKWQWVGRLGFYLFPLLALVTAACLSFIQSQSLGAVDYASAEHTEASSG
jgi:hypothetical protein